MENKNRLVLKTPAGWYGDPWHEALPVGNGNVGAGVYGAVKDETILINHGDLWHWGRTCAVPDVSGSLAKMRELIGRGEYKAADRISAQALIDAGHNALMYKPCPVGNIKIRMHEETPFKKYRRALDMEKGEVTVTWRQDGVTFSRKTFVSRTDDLIVCEISSTGGRTGADIFLQLHETFSPDMQRMRKETEGLVDTIADGACLYYAVRNDDGTDFGMVSQVRISGGSLEAGASAKIAVKDASRILILTRVFVKGRREDCFVRLEHELNQIAGDYDSLLERHAKVHSPLYHSAELSLSEGGFDRSNEELLLDAYEEKASAVLLEKLWRFARHLLISGTREDTRPFPLYGLWGGRYELGWSHNMANINLQMMYWHAMAGGQSSLFKAVIRYYCDLMPGFRENAKNIFGCKGIFVPAGTTPGLGVVSQLVPVIVNWIGGAGWLSQHFYEYWLYTNDEKLLKESILPFMLEAAEFYKDYLIMGADGFYQVVPSVSPENTPKNLNNPAVQQLGHANATVKNATMDFAIIKELFTHLISISKKTGLVGDKVPEWEEILSHIPAYQINADGAVKEWMANDLEDNYYHRHLSHLYPVFPGREVTAESDPRLLTAFQRAVEKRILGAQTGWSFVYMACMQARFSDGEKAVACLDNMCRSCLTNSFFTLHNDWRNMGLTLDIKGWTPVQLDAVMGLANAIQEMLLFVSEERLKLLPACPARLSKGSVERLRFHTGQISFRWDLEQGALHGTISSTRETDLTIQLPSKFTSVTFDSVDARAEISIMDSSTVRLKMPAQSVVQFGNTKAVGPAPK
jgi:alpha-L-fucosidase 2